MPNHKTTVPFSGTPEQKRELMEFIRENKTDRSALMGVLQKAQHVYGYLPLEVQKMIAEGLELPLEEVYGVATFYSQFSLNPKGRFKVAVCIGTACYVKGAGAVLDKLADELGIKNGECSADGKFSLDGCRCIGACGLAPVITINEDVHGRLSVDDIPEIVAKYKAME